jgi:mannose/fructose-specific phosphotransferase system component IIA
MNEESRRVGVLLAHGHMAAGIVDAVRAITGAEEDVLYPLSNRGMSPEGLVQAVREVVNGRSALLFTDLQSGSCGVAARRLAHELPELLVISGVNLPVLLEFVLHRDKPLEELVPRLLDKGRAGIGCSPSTAETHGRSAVPDR